MAGVLPSYHGVYPWDKGCHLALRIFGVSWHGCLALRTTHTMHLYISLHVPHQLWQQQLSQVAVVDVEKFVSFHIIHVYHPEQCAQLLRRPCDTLKRLGIFTRNHSWFSQRSGIYARNHSGHGAIRS